MSGYRVNARRLGAALISKWVLQVTAVCSCLLSFSVNAQLLEPIPLEIAAGVKEIRADSIRLSPDKALAAFSIHNGRNQRPYPPEQDECSSTGVFVADMANEIWIYDLKSERTIRLTSGASTSWGPAWSADGKWLAFFSDRDGAPRIWVWNRTTGKVRRLSKVIVRPYETLPDSPVWINGGQWLYTRLLPEGLNLKDACSSNPEMPRAVGSADAVTAQAFDSMSLPSGNSGNFMLADLGAVEFGTGKVRRFVRNRLIGSSSVAADGSMVVFDVWDKPYSGAGLMTSDILLCSTATGEVIWKQAEVKFHSWRTSYIWSPDRRYVMWSLQAEGYALVDTETKKFQVVSMPPAWLLHTPAEDGGKESGLPYIKQAGFGFPELYRLDPRGGAEIRLTRMNEEYDRYVLGELTEFEYLYRGESLRAQLLLPAGYEAGKRYPAIVTGYGRTPELDRSLGRSNDPQVFATRGYTVLAASVVHVKSAPMKTRYESIMAGVDKAIELGIVDADRLVISGHSDAGYTVRAVIAQTDRFKAAISNEGIGGNLFHSYSIATPNGLGAWDRWLEEWGMKGDPWTERDYWIENSPFFKYNKAITPIIVQVSTPIGETGQDIYLAYRKSGVSAELVRYYGELHVVTGYSNTVDWWQRRLNFIAKHGARPGPR